MIVGEGDLFVFGGVLGGNNIGFTKRGNCDANVLFGFVLGCCCDVSVFWC